MPKLSRIIPIGLAAAHCLYAAAVPAGPTISIVSGNGQLLCPSCAFNSQGFSFAPSVVQVTDSSGNPVSGATVTWTATYTSQSAPPTTVTTMTVTGANGQTSYVAPLSFPSSYNEFAATTVSASIPTGSVQFYETQAVPNPFDNYLPPQVTLASPPNGTTLTGAVGQISKTPIQVVLTTGFLGTPIPNVLVSLGPPTGTAWRGPTLTCMTQPGQAPGTVLTNSSGQATCTPVFGGSPGTSIWGANIGPGFSQSSNQQFTVTIGPPAAIKIVGGNNQSIHPGATAPLALLGEVVDASGNPSVGVNVTWTVTPPNGLTLAGSSPTSTSTGYVDTRVIGVTGGQYQVTVAVPNTAAQATFTVNVYTSAAAIEAVSGANQTAQIGTAFTDPLIVQVNDVNQQPVANVPVAFAVTSGSATLSASGATTNALGQAQVTVTAGQTSGPVVVTATVNGSGQTYSQTFNLTVSPLGPVFTADGVTNAASFASQFISPCSLATIFGTGITNGFQGIMEFFLAPQMQLNNVTVQFGNATAPILDMVNLNGQESITVQVPCEVLPGTVPVTITAAGAATTVPVNVLTYSPGIFQTTMSDGKLRAVIVRQDGSYVSLTNPARPGDTLRMYVTGLGQTNPPITTGSTVPLVYNSGFGGWIPETLPVDIHLAVGIDNGGVPVVGAHYAYDMIGVYEVVFEVPQNIGLGNDDPFAILLYNGAQLIYGNGSLIPIQ